jgi:NADP-reducing hydrogenase subunit HndC
MKPTSLQELDTLKAEIQKGSRDTWVKVGLSTCGIAAGAQDTYLELRQEAKKHKVTIDVKRCGCAGRCTLEPIVEIAMEGMPTVSYSHVTKDKVAQIVEKHLVGKETVNNMMIPPATDKKQMKIVLRNCGIIDPESINDYIAVGGYRAMAKCLLEMSPEAVIEEMKKSGLRGRGGAGFPTGLKWEITRKSVGDQKYIVCNADEGDPGAYMDRGVLEGDPHSVIEGLVIGGYAMGASKGFFYVRAEYPLAIERIEKALKQARAQGFVGEKIFGTDFSFDIEIRLGAGAFVCGEETALIASIEGRRGYPHPRPPFPSVKGLWDKPTCINNVETLANIPEILSRGGDWFASIGCDRSKGTKVFALTGAVVNAGLVEVPMGTTIREIVYDIGGGAAGGKKVKAIQTGGPSGGVIPEKYFDTKVTYEHLQELGSIMGSGGMIVMDEDNSMVDIAKFYLGFCVDESCGKCAPCRIGGTQMLHLLEKIADGKGEMADLDRLRKICFAMQKSSLCGLGQTAANPVLSTLRYFENEYKEYIKA